MERTRYILMVRFADFQKRLWLTEHIAVVDRMTYTEVGSISGEAILALIQHHMATASLQAHFAAVLRKAPVALPSRASARVIEEEAVPVTPTQRLARRAQRRTRR